MMRSFIVLLLLIVVFLVGMLIGIEREGGMHANNNLLESSEIEQVDKSTNWEAYEEQFILEEEMLEVEASEHTTQKVAAFLEAGVKGFYEIIVEVLFEISSFFI